MEDRMDDSVEGEASSGNVFVDLDLADADKLKIKSGLVIEITRTLRRLELTEQAAANRMGISQSKVSAMLRGEFSSLSERELIQTAGLKNANNHGQRRRRCAKSSFAANRHARELFQGR